MSHLLPLEILIRKLDDHFASYGLNEVEAERLARAAIEELEKAGYVIAQVDASTLERLMLGKTTMSASRSIMDYLEQYSMGAHKLKVESQKEPTVEEAHELVKAWVAANPYTPGVAHIENFMDALKAEGKL